MTTPQAGEIEWLMGKDRERNNQYGVSASWKDVPISSRLQQLSLRQKVAIFLDRRIDPDRLITIVKSGVTVEQFLWVVAEENGLGACLIGDVYYIGPPETAAALPVIVAQLQEKVAKLPKATRVRWQKRRSLNWDELSTPQQILNAATGSANVASAEVLPHDLWNGASLPTMGLAQNLSLIAAGFGRSIEIIDNGGSIRLVDFPVDAMGKTTFSQRKIDPKTLKQIKLELRGSKVSAKGTRLSITGPANEVAKAKSMLVTAQVAVIPPDAKKTWSLKVLANRKDILNRIAELTNRQLEIPSSLQAKLETRVDLEQSNVSLVELIAATLDGSGLSFDLSDETIRIYR